MRSGYQHRSLVPLEQAVHHVQLHGPGTNRIMVAIVWDGENRSKATCLLEKEGKSSRSYNLDVLSADHSEIRTKNVASMESASIDVDVNESFFAKEPTKWEKWWVNLMESSKAVDQCEFRKRRLFAYTIQPVVVIFWVLAGLVTALFCGFFGKKVSFTPIVSSIDKNADFSDIYEDKFGYFFTGPWTFCFRPFMLFVVLLGSLVGIEFLNDWQLLAGTFFLVLLLLWLIIGLIGSITKKFQKEKWQREEEERRRKAEALEQEIAEYRNRMESLLCSRVPTKITKPPRVTVRLLFEGVKAKVCRPFAM